MTDMLDSIQHVVYINLDLRADRRKHVEGQLARVFPSPKVQRFPAIKDDDGARGCSQSHIAVLELAKANGWPHVLVVEDDFTWKNLDKTPSVLESLMKKSYDVIVLCGVFVDCEPDGRLRSCQTATAYLVAAHYYDTLLANFREGLRLYETTGDYSKYALDQFWKVAQRAGQWYIVRPNMGLQMPGFSDIEGKQKNYMSLYR